jgi:hypothetical protein
MTRSSFLFLFVVIVFSAAASFSQPANDIAKAEAIIKKAADNVGGQKYLNIKTQIGRGRYSVIRDRAVVSFETFIDVIVFPDKERTDFKAQGKRKIQVNAGGGGWLFDGAQDLVKVQNEEQIANFKRGMRVSLDYLLRGYWRDEAKLEYAGSRSSGIGKRNEVVRLVFPDSFSVEFEFANTDFLPQKSIYKRSGADGETVTEEDRYAQFVDVGGVRVPFIIDRFTNGVPNSRINLESIEFDRPIPDSIFAKPSSAKDLKKDLKL